MPAARRLGLRRTSPIKDVLYGYFGLDSPSFGVGDTGVLLTLLMFICPHPICDAPPSPEKRLYFNDLFNIILNEEKGCRRQGTTSWLRMLV